MIFWGVGFFFEGRLREGGGKEDWRGYLIPLFIME